MAIFDSNLPLVSRGPKEIISLKSDFYKLRTYTRWDLESGVKFYSVQVNLEFKECVKKIFGVCTQKKDYRKWVDIPYNIYTPNMYPIYDPINVVYLEDIDKEFKLNIPILHEEKEWEEFSKKIKEEHKQILSF